MTIIRRIKPYGKKIITEETDKPVFFENKEIAEIDYTETTAYSHFCGIRFKDSNEFYWLPSYRLDLSGLNFKEL